MIAPVQNQLSKSMLTHIGIALTLGGHANEQRRAETLFSYVDNSLEISIFGDAEAIGRDFGQELCPRLEISNHIYRALQVDNDDTFNSSRICAIVEPLAKAGVSIFYMSTYQMDLLFVQENRIPAVFTILSQNGIHMALDEELCNTPPDTPIPDRPRFWKHDIHDIQKENQLSEHNDEEDRTLHSIPTEAFQLKYMSESSMMTPPGSRGSISDNDIDGVESNSKIKNEYLNGKHLDADAKQVPPLDIISAQKHGRISVELGDAAIPPKASPTTATAFELRQQAIRTSPQNTLRCVGLNTDLESGHQPWILKVIKILFYHDKIKQVAIDTGRGPTHDAPRFFSFTATADCVSMITDTYILEEFEEHELFMDHDTCPLRLIQLDLRRFGLDKYGIIHSVARPLTEAGIDLLYLSTFSTANILVVEHRLSDAERILSGSGATMPLSIEDKDVS
ncbi:hypothetical protein BCR41DRAFT_195846 [Lobosporangium transversale]|uniref:CASTOR ACT domain-containing protein n=1 Tax=Lobosporangium transversale TaxID=64571 RepID=A0A1Y2GD87_9FUNG|nr:hypothetical protein BCR41DRAFT_195846 [Lobosporangium transversale]ORZ04578.1 hypothetical protein BCR41DRAFT_195846 [Lobosporangium transversale]|eukprot:XP_021876624.1 hypothetical protein BCR41DRAFT_195846 [Lobosporangium transversale]